jgi:AraC-like DNA-binding protein
MEFREYIPAKLNKLVISIYERKVTAPMKVQFLPDGCITLIFNIGPKIKSIRGENVDSERFNPTGTFCFISGLHTKPIYFDMEGLHVVGLILHPAAIKAFFGLPVVELKDQAIEATFVEELHLIEDSIKSMSTFAERALWLEQYFFNKLQDIPELELALKLNRTVERMKQDVIRGERPDIGAYSGYSKMHTNRIFKDWLGLTPGKLLRYQQFQYALRLMHTSEKSLTQIGLAAGFYDQAHFIRVFEEFTRMTPGNYQKNKTGIPGILPW